MLDETGDFIHGGGCWLKRDWTAEKLVEFQDRFFTLSRTLYDREQLHNFDENSGGLMKRHRGDGRGR